MGAKKNKGYKRSWRNLLLNKQYQMTFTLLMVGLAAILMGVLGWWVNGEVKSVTRLGMNGLSDCRIEPTAPAPKPVVPERPRGKVDVDIGEMQTGALPPELAPIEPVVPEPIRAPEPPPPEEVVIDRDKLPIDEACMKEQAHKRSELLAGQHRITYVLIGVGFLLVIGLAFYGIKMTHHVAGPLHKIGLYFAKMRDGKLDTVYNLRKGDQLVEFYEHFKHAHTGLRKMEEADIARLKAMIAAAEEAQLAGKSPELAALLDEMRATLERKEKSLVYDLPKAVARDKNPTAHKTGDGRAPGTTPAAGGGPRPYKRRLGNYLIDKKLQLRYVAFVTVLSAILSGSLGYLIWAQKVRATNSVLQDFDPWIAKTDTDWAEQVAAATTEPERAQVKAMMEEDRAQRIQTKTEAGRDMAKGDSRFILKLAGAGVGLVIVLSLFLVIMTHKVAGPLFKIGNYFEQMYEGRLGNTWPLRRFDMLKDFYAKFQDMHIAVRKRAKADNEVVGRFLHACEEAGVSRQGALGHELDELTAHHVAREKSLS